MANAARDGNNVPALICSLNTDGITPERVYVNSSTHALKVSDGTTGSDFGRNVAVRDSNFVTVLMAVSSADGITPVEVYADSSGNMLVKST